MTPSASSPPRGSAASRAVIPVVEQVTGAVRAVWSGLGEAGSSAVLGDGRAGLVDELGEPAERDPLLRADPDGCRIDPVWRGEAWLRGQPGVERGLVVQELTATAAVPGPRRKLAYRGRKPGQAAPEPLDVLVATAVL
jgi:hypothetical protein